MKRMFGWFQACGPTLGWHSAPPASSCTLSAILKIADRLDCGLSAQVFDGTVWKRVTGCLVAPMNTSDTVVNKQDSHAWLFGWKNATILQARVGKLRSSTSLPFC